MKKTVGAGPCSCPNIVTYPNIVTEPQAKYTNRHSIRLKGYDYTKSGFYFITICTQHRKHLFGEIQNGKMFLNNAGTAIQNVWDEIPQFYNGINIDAFQIMPNHIHGIIHIVGTVGTVGAGPCACPNNVQPSGQPQGVAPMTLTLFDVVGRFKSITTKKYIDGVNQNNWQRFDGKLWQRNYWEHIIRNENEYLRISQYIIDNPIKWDHDKLNNGDGNIVMESQTEYGMEPWMV
jgi:REP element-mobilizing transposase RayT